MSLWRNQDQNSSQGTHEIEVLVTVKATALDMLKDSVNTNSNIRPTWHASTFKQISSIFIKFSFSFISVKVFSFAKVLSFIAF